MTEARRLTDKQIEERRRNLRVFRKELKMEGDQTFNTTLQMQEEWLATVDALLSREGELVAARAERDRMLRWVHGYLYRTPRTTVNGASVYRAIYALLARAIE